MKRLLHKLKRPLLLAILLTGVAPVQPQTHTERVLVVANVEDRDLTLTQREVRSLFMGRGNNPALKAIFLAPDNLTRVLFNTRVMGLAESRIRAYWAQMRFSGRKRPPREFEDEAEALRYVLANEGAVGYFSQDTPLPEGLVVLYRSD